MPVKSLKLGGRMVEIKAFLLPNGNLVVPSRDLDHRKRLVWIEVAPGTSLYKRWWPVRVDEPDPR